MSTGRLSGQPEPDSRVLEGEFGCVHAEWPDRLLCSAEIGCCCGAGDKPVDKCSGLIGRMVLSYRHGPDLGEPVASAALTADELGWPRCVNGELGGCRRNLDKMRSEMVDGGEVDCRWIQRIN